MQLGFSTIVFLLLSLQAFIDEDYCEAYDESH